MLLTPGTQPWRGHCTERGGNRGCDGSCRVGLQEEELFCGQQAITEWFQLEGTSKGRLVPLPALSRDTHSSISAQSPFQPDCGCLQGWGTATSLGTLCWCFTTLSIKNMFLISSLPQVFFWQGRAPSFPACTDSGGCLDAGADLALGCTEPHEVLLGLLLSLSGWHPIP